MPVQLQGSFATPAAKLQRMVALSPMWQNLIADVPRNPEAPAAVWLKNVIGKEPRPFATIAPGLAHNYTLIAGGEQNVLRADGSLFLSMALDTPQEYWDDQNQAELYAASAFGQVMDEVAALANADDEESPDGLGHLAMIGANLVEFWETEQQDWQSLGRWYFCTYNVQWGDGGAG